MKDILITQLSSYECSGNSNHTNVINNHCKKYVIKKEQQSKNLTFIFCHYTAYNKQRNYYKGPNCHRSNCLCFWILYFIKSKITIAKYQCIEEYNEKSNRMHLSLWVRLSLLLWSIRVNLASKCFISIFNHMNKIIITIYQFIHDLIVKITDQ